jgi:hypothetical protein
MVHIFSPPTGPSRHIGWMLSGLTFSVLLALGGCATVPPPDASMNLAQAQLQAARDAGAADYAPVDLGFAQDKFQQAQTAMGERKYADAANLSEESRADAELARAKARLGAARAQIQSKIQENNSLRSQDDTPASSNDQPLPAAQGMPAPASTTPPPPSGAGFQPVPSDGHPPPAFDQQPDPQGGQP